MAMVEGAVTINPATGSIISKTGCVGEVFDVIDGSTDYGDTAVTNPVAYAKAREQIAVLARAIAKVIPHIQANATVSTTVASGIAVATTGTAAAQTGQTTAPGSGSGTVS